jgi:4-hydroxybenzoate polyprenyltransferase
LTIGAAGIFVIAAWQLNALCGALSPVALIVLLGYSYTKRFTALSHYVLGIALGLAPIGAYIAITGRFSLPIIGIGVAVTCWVGGFDILYALQDLSFDRAKGLHSLPAALGEPTARRIALLSHLVAISILAGIGAVFYKSERASLLYWIGWTLFSGFVLRQHWISRDIARINRTFFTHNGIASVLFGTCAIAGLLLL